MGDSRSSSVMLRFVSTDRALAVSASNETTFSGSVRGILVDGEKIGPSVISIWGSSLR